MDGSLTRAPGGWAPAQAAPNPAQLPPDLAGLPPLARQAVTALAAAGQSVPGAAAPVVEERAIYRPDSWLVQKCWEALADAGSLEPALAVAALAAPRHPLAAIECLHRLSRRIDAHFGLGASVAQRLAASTPRLLAADAPGAREQLLLAAAIAANLSDRTLALVFLERLDQLRQPWDLVLVRPDQRNLLADIILQTGSHPLSVALLANAIRRFGDAGAQFVVEITTGAAAALRRQPNLRPLARLLALGMETFQNATLTTLHSRRLAVTVFGQAGMTADVLAQLTTIANVQSARRESGLALRQGDAQLLRQVKRPHANADVDFQVYTLQEAVRAMPLRQLPREVRIELANALAALGSRSDGWTAAGAAATLVELGAVKFAVEVVEKIPAGDATRAEGVISLVRGLLAVDEPELAAEQVQKGLAWARSYPSRNPERALIWGLAEVYLEHGQPGKALDLVGQWRSRAGFNQRLRRMLGRRLDDDELRISGLRLRALLAQDTAAPKEIQNQVSLLRTWAPRLLEGEALINFLLDDLLKPLLASGRTRQAYALLPVLQEALRSGSGEKHAMRVAAVIKALTAELAPTSSAPLAPSSPNGQNGEAGDAGRAEEQAAMERFLIGIWTNDVQRGLWQTVHGIEGSLSLVIALEGPATVAAIAQHAAILGDNWVDDYQPTPPTRPGPGASTRATPQPGPGMLDLLP